MAASPSPASLASLPSPATVARGVPVLPAVQRSVSWCLTVIIVLIFLGPAGPYYSSLFECGDIKRFCSLAVFINTCLAVWFVK